MNCDKVMQAKEEEGIPRPRWVLRTYEKDAGGNLGKLTSEYITPAIRRERGVVSFEFKCKCGKRGWIADGYISPPCPECGREYVGVE